MKAKLVGNTLEVIPTNGREKDLLYRIVSLQFEPVTDMLTDDNGTTLTNLVKLRFRFQVAPDGTEVADAIVET